MPSSSSRLAQLRVERAVLLVVGGEDDRALADLDRRGGQDAIDRAIGIGRLDVGQRRGREDRDDRLGVRRHLGGDGRELRRLVAQDHDVGALGDLGRGGERLAADLVGQRPRALGDDVGAQHGPTPAEGEPPGHAPGADEAEHHRVSFG